MINFSVASGKHASLIDKEVRLSLYESLCYLNKYKLLQSLSIPSISNWVARPVDFGWYYDLITSFSSEKQVNNTDNYKSILKNLNDSFYSQPIPDSIDSNKGSYLRITSIREPWYNEEHVECILRWLDIEPENDMGLIAVDSLELAMASEKLHKAIKLLEILLPDFMREMLAIITEIIFAKPSGSQKLTFGGISSFTLWGALVLNHEAHQEWWEYVPRLVHEYSHNLLFGIARNEPLVLNDVSERHYSPLRRALRPMDGIYHALYVSAREAFAMRKIINSPEEKKDLIIDCDEVVSYCKNVLIDSTQSFEDCLLIVKQSGELSDLGSAVMADIVNAMNKSDV